MSSIFNEIDNAKIIERINKLKPDTLPLWGKTTVSQMMPHCGVAIRIAFGEPLLKRGLVGILFGRLIKKSIMKDKPAKRNSPTLKPYIIKEHKGFEQEKIILINHVRRFAAEGASVLRQDAHPVFGEMTTEEWDKLMWKHLDHHLSQFGV
jgi:hypothetical protein